MTNGIETYYFVEEVSTATPENKNWLGHVHTYIKGKDYNIYVDVPDGWHNRDLRNCPNCIKEYGYKRACDAKRNWTYRNPQNDDFWKTTVKIVSFSIRMDANGNYQMA